MPRRKAAERSPATRYALRRNITSIMKFFASPLNMTTSLPLLRSSCALKVIDRGFTLRLLVVLISVANQPSLQMYGRLLCMTSATWLSCTAHRLRILRDGFDSRLGPIAFDKYTGWLLTRRAQAHFAVSLNYF